MSNDFDEKPESELEKKHLHGLRDEIFSNKPSVTKLEKSLENKSVAWRSARREQQKAFRIAFSATLRFYLAASPDMKLVIRLRKRCKEVGIIVTKDTPVSTLVVKLFLTDKRTLAHKYSTALRGAVIEGVSPAELEKSLGKKGGITLAGLIDAFQRHQDLEEKGDGAKGGDVLPRWTSQARTKFANLAKKSERLIALIAVDAKLGPEVSDVVSDPKLALKFLK